MNTRTHTRADRCQLKSTAARPWVEREPFSTDDEPDDLDEPWTSDTLDAMLDEDEMPEDMDLDDFLDRFD